MINIVIIEDNQEVLEAYYEILNAHPEIGMLRGYTSCEEALKHLDAPLPDVVMMDLQLPGMDGIEGTRKIKQKYPSLNVIVVTVHSESQKVFDALCAGASGYITKNTEPEKLVSAIKDIQNGGAPMSSNIARMVVGSFQRNMETPLTRRETEVLQLLSQGKTTPLVAEQLFVSKETIRSHMKNIYSKLQANTKAEAIEKAKRDRLI
jgi:DNA-binding NarL/FixJ family response regulator